MKIHKIQIENIASLKGAHNLDLDEIQIEAGSFAITGDTGSGKSTILNCISLALYGRSYKNLTQGDFVTLGQSAGKVELEFSCSGRRYLSIWGCRVRKKNGEYLKTPTHTKEFYELQGEEKKILEITPEEVVQLSFEQFCKTVILNQGEFAKFLTSTFRERKDILEKLYQGQKLDSFNPLLRAKVSKFAQDIDQIQAQMDGLGQGISEEVTEEGLENLVSAQKLAEEETQALKSIIEELKDVLELKTKAEQTKTKLEETSQQIQIQTTRLNELKKDKLNFDKEREKFLNEQKELSPLLHQALENKKTLITEEKNGQEMEISLEKFEKDLLNSNSTIQKTKDELEKIELELKAIEGKKTFKKLEEEEFERLKKDFQRVKEAKLASTSSQEIYTRIRNDWQTWKKEEETSKAECEKLQRDLKALKEENLEEKKSHLEDKLNSFRQFSASFNSFSKEQARLKKETNLLSQEIEKSKNHAQIKEQNYKEVLSQIEVQKDALKAIEFESSKLECLNQSIDRGRCVICGNDQVSHLSTGEHEKTKSKIIAYQENLSALEERAIQGLKELERANSIKANHSSNWDKSLNLQKSNKADFFKASKSLISSLELKAEHDLEQMGPEAAQAILEEEIGKTQENLKSTSQKCQNYETKKQTLSNLMERLEFSVKKLQTLESEGKAAKRELENAQKEIHTLEQVVIKLTGQESLELAAAYIDEKQKWFLLKRKFDDSQKELKHQSSAQSVVKERISELNKRLEKSKQLRSSLAQSIKKASPNKDPELAIRDLEEAAETLEIKNKKLTEAIQALQVEASALFSRKGTYEEQIKDQENLGLTHWAALKERKPSIFALAENEFSHILKSFLKLESPEGTHTLSLALELGREEYTKSLQRGKAANERLTEYKTILSRQKSAKEKINSLLKERDKKEVLKQEWEELHILIGKDEFRNYILSMVEKLLIQQTNRELEKLCDGRYLIQHKQSSSRLAPDFYIIDKFRSDETRKVSTLSGGETFMVSLAMALALAELTRGNADIESFFIDEGFGTLDQDSLEEALEMLQDIETRGKQIGLISHVKELTNRIPVNIHLVKNRLGNSSIELVYN